MLKKMCRFIILVVHFIFIDGLCEVMNTMISEMDDLCSSTFGLTL